MTERYPRICVECGKPVIHSARAKTCSEKCRKERLRKLKHALYEQKKGSEHFKAQQAKYIAALKEKRAADSDFDAAYAAAHKKAVQKSVKKRNADPERREQQLQKSRAWKTNASAEQKEKIRQANRNWYARLSPDAKAAYVAEQVERRRRRNAAAGSKIDE